MKDVWTIVKPIEFCKDFTFLNLTFVGFVIKAKVKFGFWQNFQKSSNFLIKIYVKKAQVPHSQCSLRENPKFLQNLRSKNNTLKATFWLIFLLNICHCNSGLALKCKNYYITSQNCMFLIRENSHTYVRNTSELCEWGTWILYR
jgi:hypothetical protein